MRASRNATKDTFQYYIACPKIDRKKYWGFSSQRDFAEHYDLNEVTLSNWKKEEGFMDGVEKIRRQFLDEALTDIYDTLIKRAKAGDGRLIEFAFKLSNRYSEKQKIDITQTKNNEVALSDDELIKQLAIGMKKQQAFDTVDVEDIEDSLREVLNG